MAFYGLKYLYLAWFPQKLVKVRGSPGNKVSQNTFKNFLWLRKLLDLSGLWRTLEIIKPLVERFHICPSNDEYLPSAHLTCRSDLKHLWQCLLLFCPCWASPKPRLHTLDTSRQQIRRLSIRIISSRLKQHFILLRDELLRNLLRIHNTGTKRLHAVFLFVIKIKLNYWED